MTQKAVEAIRSKGVAKKPMTQKEAGQILLEGLDIILQKRMERRGPRQGVCSIAFEEADTTESFTIL